MTIMIPDHIAPGTPSSERHFFRNLKDDPDTDGWIALHSLNLARHKTKLEGECDMVVIVPKKGILVIEIKGVGVRRKNGMWHYDDGRSPDHGPFKQVGSARWSLLESLKKKDPMYGRLLFWSVVIFTSVPFKESSQEWHDWQCINSDDIKSRAYSVIFNSILEKAHSFVQNTPGQRWYDPTFSRPSLEIVTRLKDALRKDFNYVSSQAVLIRNEEDEIKRFTDEQLDAVDTIQANSRCVVRGPAGTGKTLIASEVFRGMVESGSRVLFVCYNKNLAYYLKNSLMDVIGYATADVRLSTFHSLISEHIEIPDNPGDDFWSEKLPMLFQEYYLSHNFQPLYDYVIVDESQDLMSDNYLDCLDLILEGGIKNGNWVLFGDFDNQAIYSALGSEDLHTLDSLKLRDIQYSTQYVKKNCRNSYRIVSWIEAFVDVKPKYSARLPDSEISSVRFKWWSNQTEQTRLLEVIVEESLKDYKPSDIVILSPFTVNPSIEAASYSIKNRISPVGSIRDEDRNKLKYSSIHGFKGLESQVVILTDIYDLSDEHLAVFYVGMSRAKIKVVILIHEFNRTKINELARV